MAEVKIGLVREQTGRVLSLLGNISSVLGDRSNDELVDTDLLKLSAEGMMDPLEELLELIPDSATSELGDFFTNVGMSIVSAQSQLDLASMEYNRRLQESDDHELVPPTSFRLPKASASFKFAMSSASSRGFNVFVASARDVQKRAAEQEVSFDIVAAPPSPEVMAKWAERDGRRKPTLVRSRVERGEVERLFFMPDLGRSKIWSEQEDLKSILVFRDADTDGGVRRRWFLLYVGDTSAGGVDEWTLAFATLTEKSDLSLEFSAASHGNNVMKAPVKNQILVAMASLLGELLPE